MFKVLIVEDDYELRELFKKVLIKQGYDVTTCENGRVALDILEKEYTDIIISDIMMPEVDGFELVKSLRDSGNMTPVLMITAKVAFDDMRQGFLAGADDYLVKPVNVNEMVLRVAALLRRAEMINKRKIVIGSTELISDSFTVVQNGKETVLPQKEFLLLFRLASFPDKIFTRAQIMDEIWGYETDTDPHSVEVHIGRLRDKFRDSKDFQIVTIRGVGYKVVKL